MNKEELNEWLIVIFIVELYKVSSYNMDGRVNLTFFVLRELKQILPRSKSKRGSKEPWK